MNTTATPRQELQGRERIRVIAASSAGNFAEWFDFGLYGVMATVIASHFFPAGNPTVALISTYGIFALTYFTRPAGGLLAGWLADTLGRKSALFVSISIMTIGTGAIGLLPTYAAIGVGAPVLLLLCRLLQGLGAGGEYGSAVTFISEHSTARDRATNVSYMVASTFLGVLAAVGLASLATTVMSEAVFEAWGWRILFLLSVPLGLIGIYIRKKVSETPDFEAVTASRDSKHEAATPVRTAFTTQWSTMVLFVFVIAVYALITPTLSSYFVTFLKETAGLSSGQAYNITLIADVLLVISALLAGRLMKRFGLFKVMFVGALYVAVTAIPAFALSTTGFAGAIAGGALLALGKGILAVPAAFAIAALFPAKVRVTAGSLSYNVCVVLFGASGPLLGVWLNGHFGNSSAFSFYLCVVAAVSALATIIGRRKLRWSSFDVQAEECPAAERATY